MAASHQARPPLHLLARLPLHHQGRQQAQSHSLLCQGCQQAQSHSLLCQGRQQAQSQAHLQMLLRQRWQQALAKSLLHEARQQCSSGALRLAYHDAAEISVEESTAQSKQHAPRE